MRRILAGAMTGAALLLVVGAACVPAEGPEPRPERSPAQPADPAHGLAASLHAETFADSVRFTLRITNASGAPVELTFPTGQSFDFLVRRQGEPVWRWSEGMMFTQAIRHETLAPEETRSYTATWAPAAGAQGEHTVEGFLTALEHRLEQRAEFRIP